MPCKTCVANQGNCFRSNLTLTKSFQKLFIVLLSIDLPGSTECHCGRYNAVWGQ